MSKLIHPELGYQVRGVLLDVYKKLGPRLKERYYQDAIVVGLEERRIACTPEKDFEVFYEGVRAGLYYLVEQLKVRLRRLDLELGLLANFHGTRLAVTPVRVQPKTATAQKGIR